MTRSTLLAIFILFGVSITYAQPYYFRHYQVENGLSNNAVICSVQDKKGFLWFGTKDGLDRFDGYSFKIFRHDPQQKGSIGSNFIHSLFVDKDDVLWVGTEKGLYRYDATTENFTLLSTPFLEQVTDIQMDARGQLWFISNFNLFRYHPVSKALQHFLVPQYFEATSICTMPDGGVYVSTSAGLIQQYDQQKNTFTPQNLFRHSPKPASLWIEKIYATSSGLILVGTSNQGVKLFDPRSKTYKDILTYNTDRTEIFARNFVQTSQAECWIATESGIFIYNFQSGKVVNLRKDYDNPYTISDNAVYTFCKDREGGIWCGTYFGGINYFPKQALSFQKYFPENGKNGLTGNVVREIHQDEYDNLWIGTEDAGLNRMNMRTGKFESYTPTGSGDGISYTNIHGLLATDDELWIGTFEHGLDVMDIRTGKVVRHYSKNTDSNSLKSNFIYCIYQSPDSNIMLGTTIGAYRYNRHSDNFSPIAGLPLYTWYSSLLKDDKGVIWAATYGNGLNFVDTRTGATGNFRYDENNRNSLASDRINSLFHDSKNNLWLATEGGLCKFDRNNKQFARYTTENGFPTNFILSMLEDDEKNLWISTSKGLVRLNPTTGQVNVYTKANGLLNDQFNFSSAFKDRKGVMYFGSVKGMISFHPGELVKNDFVPAVYFTGFQVNNKELSILQESSPLVRSITYTDKITLQHHQSTFSIDFASLSYAAPEMSEYAYKLDGLDHDWVYLKTNRKVYFTNLSAGDYVFRVKTASSSGRWDVAESRLIITILPPWWASNLAYAIYTLAILSLIYLGARTYHERLKEKNARKIEHMEIVKEKELYEAKMQFFTNVAHEIKTPLTLIKGPLEKVMRKAGEITEIKDSLRIMSRNTDRLVDLTNQLLDFRQTEINGFGLTFTKQDITEILDETFLGFKSLAEQKELSFRLENQSEPVFALIDTDAFTKIITNLLSNAIKYARSSAELKLLPVMSGDDSFTIEVKNDGYLIPLDMKEKIFEPFFRLKETEKQKGTGIGLALSRSLAALQKGVLNLRDPDGRMNIFYLTLPLHQDALNGTTETTLRNDEAPVMK